MIRVRNLRRSTGERDLVRVPALDFPTGSVTGIIGPTGAGKSTLLRCLCLIDAPDFGTIEINGEEYTFPSTHGASNTAFSPWPSVTAVFQDINLWGHLSLRDNIRLPTRANIGLDADTRFARIVEQLDLRDLVDRYPHQLSGGERQRAAIGRAIMQKPRVLLLDEPTAASDVEHSHSLAGLLRELASNGTTIVLVSHHLGFARQASDFVVFLDHGNVLKSGPIDLLASPSDERIRRFVSVL